MRWDELLVYVPSNEQGRRKIEKIEDAVRDLAPNSTGLFHAFIDCLMESGVSANIIIAALKDTDRYFALPLDDRSGMRGEACVREALARAKMEATS